MHLYRRHRRDCKSGHPEDSKSGELEERKKTWKRCDCPIFGTASVNKNRKRQSTKQWEWDAAKAVATEWEKTGNWAGGVTQPTPSLVPSPGSDKRESRATIFDATEAYLARCRTRNVTDSTLSKYRTFVKQLRAYSDDRGYVVLAQLTIHDADRFYASWKDGIRARAKKLERFKAFAKFCVKRKWLPEDITEDLQAPEGSSTPANKEPFTDAELQRIYEACDKIGPPKPPGPGYRPWGGEDVKDFVMLSVYTGLRISDVSMFNVARRLNGNDVFLRMHKTKKELFTWIPDWLVDRLRARQEKHGDLVFRAGTALNMRSVSERWRENLNKVFAAAGEFPEHPHHHRFRHTFARMLLENGVPVPDVAELIGDTEAVVRRHYARWVRERQARLSKILQDALGAKPRP